MPRFFDDYSNTYLTHDSAAGRKQQRRGWKFRENFKLHYQKHLVEWQKGEMGLAGAQQAYIKARGKEDPMIPPLPDGWKEDLDECTGISFYYNEETGERSWVRPGFIPPKILPPPGRGANMNHHRGGMNNNNYNQHRNNNYNNSSSNNNNNRGGNFGGGGYNQNRGGYQQQQQQQHRPPPPPNTGNRPHFFHPPPGGLPPPQQQQPPQPSFLHPSALPGAQGRPPFNNSLPRPPPPGGFQRPPGYG